jgi:hypothetical protein
MWGRNKKNINTVALYKKLGDKKNKTVAEEATLFGPKYYPLNLLESTGILNVLTFRDLLSLSAVDKQVRLGFVNGNRYRGMFFNSVYNGRVNTLTKDKNQLEGEFKNQMRRQKALAERQGRWEEELACCRRKCLDIQMVFFSASAFMSLMMVMAFSVTHDDDTSLERARLHEARIQAAISFGVIVAFGALVLGLLQYSILRTRPYKQSQINAFLKETEALQLSLPNVLPENQAEWEAAFDKLVALENRVDRKLDHLRRLSGRDVEGQRGMDDRSSLVRNRF